MAAVRLILVVLAIILITVLIQYGQVWLHDAIVRPLASLSICNGTAMPILRIQHAVPNFEGWKRAFDNDPMDRKGSGVRRYHVHRSLTDPNFVMIDLELDTLAEAERLLEKLRGLWAGPGGAVMRNPSAWIVETVESKSV